MTAFNLRFGALLLSLVLTAAGIGLAATGGSPPLATAIVPFGCGA